MKLIFMGTPDFAVPTLAALHNAGHNIISVYTQPPRPAGRGHKIHLSAVHQYAEAHNLAVSTPESFKSVAEIEKFNALQADAAIIAAYGLLLPLPILQAPYYGCFNVHASLLPRWRGAAPIQRALLAGDHETGITIMQMEQGLDTGPILLQDSVSINMNTTTVHLYERLSRLGARLMVQALEKLQSSTLKPVVQPLEGITYAQKLHKEEGRVNWQESAEILERKVRALNPWPGVWFEYKTERIKILQAEVIETPQEALPGEIRDSKFAVACGQGALRLLKIQKAGARPSEGQAFFSNHSLRPGIRLS